MKLTIVIASMVVSLSCGAQSPAPDKSIVNEVIHNDSHLASLERKLASLYRDSQKNIEQAKEQARLQSQWLAERNNCAKSDKIKYCLAESYQHRIVVLQIQTGSLKADHVNELTCGTKSWPVFAEFYQQTELPSVVLTFGNDQMIALKEKSSSNLVRYSAHDVHYSNDDVRIRLMWKGASYTCKEVPKGTWLK